MTHLIHIMIHSSPQEMFSDFKVLEATELTLGGNALLSDVHRLTWNIGGREGGRGGREGMEGGKEKREGGRERGEGGRGWREVHWLHLRL